MFEKTYGSMVRLKSKNVNYIYSTKMVKFENQLCSNCSGLRFAKHILVKGLGCYPNYRGSFVCDVCSNRIEKLNDYEWDVNGIIDLYAINDVGYTLAYFGAGWDFFTITESKVWKNQKVCIY